METLSSHYNEQYFEWQRKTGVFTGVANRLKFLEFASKELNILDFGCGGGFMLKGLPAKEKLGVEINASARRFANENGVRALSSTDEVPDDWADLIISDHVLEHIPTPFSELRKLWSKVKPGGKVVFVVPCENIDLAYDPQDINQHLFSWSPMSLGNLFKNAGFEVLSSEPFYHKHLPYSHCLRPLVGEKIFNSLCYIHGRLNWRKHNEVRLVAIRPKA